MLPSSLPIVVHIVTGLPVGGAQTVIYELARAQDRIGIRMVVISLGELGEVGERLRDLGVEVRALGLDPARPNPLLLLRLSAWLRRIEPDIVQTWLYHGDLVGGIAAYLAGVRRIFWNIRQTDLDPAHSKRHTIWTARLCARLSRRLPVRIVCCSEASRTVHAALGYEDRRMLVIGNGVDTERFRPDESARTSLIRELGVPNDAFLVGLVARFHPQKDHETFLAASARAAKQQQRLHFVLCGQNVSPENSELKALAADPALRGRVHLLGIQTDIPRLNAAFDVAVSSSAFGEGFSNAVIEAMACGTPCIVTDVGDSHVIVGDTGWRISTRDTKALSGAMVDAASLTRGLLTGKGHLARARIAEHYSFDAVARAYRELYTRPETSKNLSTFRS